MLKLSVIAIFFSHLTFAACLPPSTNETGCHIDASQLRVFKTYLGCRQDNYHDYCLKLVENGVSLPGIGFVGTSTDKQIYARKLASNISKSKEATEAVAGALLTAAVVELLRDRTPQGSHLSGPPPGYQIDSSAWHRMRENTLKNLDLSSFDFEKPMTLEQAKVKLAQIMQASPRTTIEPLLLRDTTGLYGHPAGYLGPGTTSQSKFAEISELIKRQSPPMMVDFPDRPVQPDHSAAAKMKERIAERATGMDFEGDHPDLKAIREAKEAHALREIPQMTKKEVQDVSKAMAKRLSSSGVAGVGGAVAGIAAAGLVELITLSYEDRLQKQLDCAGSFPFVPTEGRKGNSADGFTCRPLPFPNLAAAEKPFTHSSYPKEIGMFLALPDDEQLKLLNVKAGKHFGICDYYERAYSDVFTGTKFCTGDGSKASTPDSAEGKKN